MFLQIVITRRPELARTENERFIPSLIDFSTSCTVMNDLMTPSVRSSAVLPPEPPHGSFLLYDTDWRGKIFPPLIHFLLL